jgi:hypothetical protein
MKLEHEDTSHLTVEQCEELATAIAEKAAPLAAGAKREDLLALAQSYRHLAAMKRFIARKVN